jgi:hypothetical protein
MLIYVLWWRPSWISDQYKKQKLCRGPSNYEENVSKRFFSESSWTIETKLPMNDHWKVLYKGGGHLGLLMGIKNTTFVEDLSMIIPGQFGFNCPSGFREEAF